MLIHCASGWEVDKSLKENKKRGHFPRQVCAGEEKTLTKTQEAVARSSGPDWPQELQLLEILGSPDRMSAFCACGMEEPRTRPLPRPLPLLISTQ